MRNAAVKVGIKPYKAVHCSEMQKYYLFVFLNDDAITAKTQLNILSLRNENCLSFLLNTQFVKRGTADDEHIIGVLVM